jgi:hypothetical protein
MNKQRKTSNILNVFQYDETTGAVTLPSTLVLTAPASDDNSTKVGTTAWVRTYVSGLSYQEAITLTVTGTSGAATLVGNTLNIPTYTLVGLGGQAALSGTGFVKISGTTISYDNSTYATETYVGTAISNLVDSSPSTLDTLNELAAALGDDPNFATTVATSIGTKQNQLNGTGFVKVTGTTVSYDNSTYLTTSTAASTYITIATPTTITGVKTFDTGTLILAAAGTANSTHLRNSSGDGTSVSGSNVFGFNSSNNIYVRTQSKGGFIFNFNNGAANRTYTLPDATGTISLTSDLGSYVPYTGATEAVNLGTHSLSANNLTANGGTNAGRLELKNADNASLIRAGYFVLSPSSSNTIIQFGFGTGASTWKNFGFSSHLIPDNTITLFSLPSGGGTIAVVGGAGVGTVTSVAALTIGTSGTDLSSSVANSTTTPVITLNVPTASAANRGALSAADWSTFNSKQNALNGTGFVKASGTTITYDNSTYYLASNPSGYITGNQTITLSGDVSGSGTTSISVTVNRLTYQGDYANNSVGTTRGPEGLSLRGVYVNGYPIQFGNILHLKGGGAGQLLVGWSGTDGAHADNYVRSKRDNDSGAWSSWAKVWTDVNLTNLNQLTNGPGYITGYTETDTLATVTARGASTSAAITLSGAVNIYNTDSNDFRLYYQGAASGSARVYYHQPTNELRIYATAATTDGTTSIGSLKLYISSVYREVLHSGNYNSYSPTLTGGGASGTWGINVTGTAGSETLATITGRGSTTSTAITINNFLTVGAGADFNLRAASGNTDTGDIVFQDGSGNELHRLWQGSSTLNYRTNGGTSYQLWHTGNLTNLNQLTNGPGYITNNLSGVKTYGLGSLGANGEQTRRYEIARLGIDFNDWNSVGSFEVELHENYFGQGLKKVYNIWYGYVSNSGIRLVEQRGAGANNFRVVIGNEVVVSGDHRYLPVFVDVQYYGACNVIVRTNRSITENSNTAVGAAYIFTSPSGTNISSFGLDETVEFTTHGSASVPGNFQTTSGSSYLRASGITNGSYIELSGNLPGYSNGQYPVIKSGGSIHFANNNKYAAFLEGSNTYFGIMNSSQVTKVFLNTNGNSYLTGGNLGIGNTDPGALLHVSGKSYIGTMTSFNPAVEIRGSYYGAARLQIYGLDADPNAHMGFGTDMGAGAYELSIFYSDVSGSRIAFGRHNGGNGTRYSGFTITATLSYGGTFTASGDVVAYGSPSDARLKTIKEKVPNALDKILKLNGYRFDWNKVDSLTNIKEDVGVIAQEVEAVIPELARTNDDGQMSVRYQGLTAVLIEAIKEQQIQIEDLKNKLESLI